MILEILPPWSLVNDQRAPVYTFWENHTGFPSASSVFDTAKFIITIFHKEEIIRWSLFHVWLVSLKEHNGLHLHRH